LIDRLLNLDISVEAVLNDEVGQVLAKVYQTPTISRPGWRGDEETTVDIEEDSDKDTRVVDIAADMRDSDLVNRIAQWLLLTKDLRKPIKPSAVMVGKVWTRLYFSLDKVSSEQGGKIGAASLMELFALCVINALLVEELDHHLLDEATVYTEALPQIDRSNPVSAASVVSKKFQHVSVTPANMPLTFLISSCPLILGLLRHHTISVVGKKLSSPYADLLNILQPYGVNDSALCDGKTWDLLNESFIAGQRWPRATSSKNADPEESLDP